MGRTKPFSLSSGLPFKGVGEAELYFKEILNNTPIDQAIDSKHLSAVLALYRDYCIAKPGYDVPYAPKNVFRRKNNEERPGGSYAVTTCFYVQFDNGDEVYFSYRSAVKAIANYTG